jgi:hypothetical protein
MTTRASTPCSLGHSQISLTQNTYQHVMPKVMSDASERGAEVLFGPTGPSLEAS